MPDFARLASALGPHYRLDRQLGEGGMAQVWLAHDVRHGRDVALKVLRPELSAVLGRDRFLAEIRLAAQLDHPHILTLIDSGEHDGILWYAMPYVRGGSLRTRLARETQLAVEDALAIARDVASALEYAHQRGIVHRDLKPENILFHEGEAMLADFGIALAVREAGGERLTETGLSLGTPQYMSPEQAAGERSLDGRSDIHALGSVLYEMLTGEPPHRGATAQATIAKLMTERPTPLAVVRPSVPAPIARAVEQALEKLPADRPRSAAAFAALLDAPIVTPSTPTLAVPTPRGSRTMPRLAAGAALLAAAALGVVFLRRTASSAPIALGQSVPVSTDAGLELDAALSPDGRLLAYAAGPLVGTRIFVRQVEKGRPVGIGDSAASDQRFPRWSPDGTRLLYCEGNRVVVVPALGGQARVIVRAPGIVLGADWSPDGREVAFVALDTLFVASTDGGTPRALFASFESHSPAWSPDGRFIALVAPNNFYVLSTYYGNAAVSSLLLVPRDGGPPIALTEASSLAVSPAWLPDGRTLLFVADRDGTRDVYALRLAADGRPAGAPERLSTGLRPHSLAISRDGRRLAYNVHTSVANIWALPYPHSGTARASEARPVTRGNQVVEYLSLSPDGRWLYYDTDRTGRAEIHRVSTSGGEPEQLTDAAGGNYLPEASPDGRWVVFQSQRGGTRDLYVMPSDGGPATPVVVGPGNDNHPSWSADGRRILFDHGGGGLPDGIYTVERGGSGWAEPQRLPGLVPLTRFGPDGSDVYTMLVGGDSLFVQPADGGPRRLAWARRSADDPVAWFAQSSLAGGRVLLHGTIPGPEPRFGIWEVARDGGEAREILRFDEPFRAGLWGGMDTDGTSLYFTMNERESDIWVTELRSSP